MSEELIKLNLIKYDDDFEHLRKKLTLDILNDFEKRLKIVEKEINFIKTKGRRFDEDTKGNSKEDRRKKKG